VIELGGRENLTTNNRMELTGAIEGLKHCSTKNLKSIEIHTDSEYVKKGMTEWIEGWIRKGWKTAAKRDVLNKDLWQSLKDEEKRLQARGVQVIWKYVQAHVGIALNERADAIATSCADDAEDLELYRGVRGEYPYFS
jgi:ribonuclease HI